MANPWEILPGENVGDDSPEKIFTAVGAALTTWEYLQIGLTILLCEIFGRNDEAVLLAVGTLRDSIPKTRMLKQYVRSRKRHASRDIHGQLLKFLKEVDNFNQRRNDIAHGIASKHTLTKHATGYFLMPAPSSEKHKISPHQILEGYRWNSAQVAYYAGEFFRLRNTANALYEEFSALQDKSQPPSP